MHALDNLKQDDIFIQVTAIVVSFNAAAGLVSVGVKSVKMSAYLLYRREILPLARRHEEEIGFSIARHRTNRTM